METLTQFAGLVNLPCPKRYGNLLTSHVFTIGNLFNEIIKNAR